MDSLTQDNQPEPRRSRILTACVAAATLLVAAGGSMYFHAQRPKAISIGGPFQLTDGSGRNVTNRSWPGKYLLVYFGYTYCPDVCPTTLNNVAAALQALGKTADRMQPIFITVDPGRDTPKTLTDYTKLFTPRLVGLTGTADQIAHVAQEYHVYYAKVQTGPGPNDYGMDHSSIIYLMAPDGHFITTIDAEQQPSAMAAQISQRITSSKGTTS
jgi:protein SCO1/2